MSDLFPPGEYEKIPYEPVFSSHGNAWHCTRCKSAWVGDPSNHVCIYRCVFCGDTHEMGKVCQVFIAALIEGIKSANQT